MAKIRVLVVDDAVAVRRMVTDALSVDPEIEVVGTAANGRIALAKLSQVNPELVTLDVEMPDMDGLQALAAIRKTHPRLPVIMFSTLTQRGAAATLDALALGANDYVTKPANVGSVVVALQRIREELIPKIKGLCRKLAPPPLPALSQPVASKPRPQVADRNLLDAIEVVAIGVSTGGPNALGALLPALPETFPVPVVIVQHMPPMFTRLLAERLNGQSRLMVREGVAGEKIQAGEVWIAPGDYHMVVHRVGGGVCLGLQQAPPENSCRPAVDVLFRSVAEAYGPAALGVVLTGMGQDGLRGSEALVEAGGHVLAQDEPSSVVWGMPGFVARAGLADQVLPLDRIAAEIVRRVRRGSTMRRAPANLVAPVVTDKGTTLRP